MYLTNPGYKDRTPEENKKYKALQDEGIFDFVYEIFLKNAKFPKERRVPRRRSRLLSGLIFLLS